jgi:hypothetical protein
MLRARARASAQPTDTIERSRCADVPRADADLNACAAVRARKGQLPSATQLAYVHTAIDALLARTTNRRRILTAVSARHSGRRSEVWSVASDGQVLP